MYADFLKKTEATIEGQAIELTQISGLDRYHFIEYLHEQSKLAELKKPSDEGNSEQYLIELEKYIREMDFINFKLSCRLIAYSTLRDVPPDEREYKIESQQLKIMSSFSSEQIKELSTIAAELSKIPMGDDGDSSDADSESTAVTQEKKT